VLVAALHPWLQRAEAEPSSRVDERTVAPPAPVAAPAVAIAQEARLSAPALVERVPPRARAETGASRAADSSSTGAPSRPVAARAMPATPASYAMPSREGIIADGQGAEAPPTPAPPPAAPSVEPDRWQVLRAELDRCQPLGVFERATCEQQARLVHCDSYWGHVALCPPLLADSRR
jgi:hypothetical protein